MIDKPKVLPPIRPNQGIRMRYQRQMLALIEEMDASMVYWSQAQYRDSPPALAMDATPSEDMIKRFKELSKKWQDRWNKAAPKIAQAYMKGSFAASDSAMRAALRKAGISVKFQMTPAVRDAFQASLAENVGLIESIPAQYFTQIEGVISRTYSGGRSLKTMIDGIKKQGGVTQRRASIIARDQTNKAHATIERARRLEIGIVEAEWMHSGGGKHPRPEHVKAGKERRRYRVADGCPIPDAKGVVRKIQPGQEINCRCVSRSIIPGLFTEG